MTETELTTPALVVDLGLLQQNIDEAAELCRRGKATLRPHIKTHKCVEIARMQMRAGAVGITVQTAMEVEVFSHAGFDDIFLARPPIQPSDLDRLAGLAATTHLRIAADSPIGIRAIGEACLRQGTELSVRIEIDAGLGRGGVRDLATLETQCLAIERQANLHFDGVFGYEGQVYGSESKQDLVHRATTALDRVLALANPLRERSGRDFVISMGSTPAFAVLADTSTPLELRPGNYVFSDAKLAPLTGFERCAQSVLSTVISRPSEQCCILDCGMKSLAAELHPMGMLQRTSFGHIVEYPVARITSLSEEHAVADLSSCATHPEIGERVHVVSNHACTTTNLHERINAVRDGCVEHTWTVTPRGVWS